MRIVWKVAPPVLAFIAFLLSLLVSVSLPVTKSLTLFHLSVDSSSLPLDGISRNIGASFTGRVDFGMWGFCIPGINLSIGPISIKPRPDTCLKPMLGYSIIDQKVVNALGNLDDLQEDRDAMLAGTRAFVLHIITAVLAFLYLGLLLVLLFRRTISKRSSQWSLGLAVLTAIFATITFLLDLIFTLVLRGKVSDKTSGLVKTTFGNGTFLMLGASLAMWLAVVCAIIDYQRTSWRPKSAQRLESN